MKKLTLVFLFYFSLLLAEQTIQRDFVPLRKGPGSYYPVETHLKQGTAYRILTPAENWIEIQADSLSGYVASPLLQKQEEKTLSRSDMVFQRTDIKVAAMGITAGIKGFAGKYSRQFAGDETFLDVYSSFKFDAEAYEKFRKETYRKINLRRVRRKIKPIPVAKNRNFTFSEQALGLGIASKIASIGLYRNPAMEDYINFVGMLLVEASDTYFQNYTFFILNDDSINAYSCPGGIVFITLGMLKAITNEAELAFVLAHEIAHVTFKHGMIEAEHRKEHLLADDLFAEMDEELEKLGKYQENETVKELEQLTVGIYETVYQGRLAEYEDEADEYAIHLMQRAAYPAEAAQAFLTRLSNYSNTSNNEHYTPAQIKSRVKNVHSYIYQNAIRSRDLIRNHRFEELVNQIRFQE